MSLLKNLACVRAAELEAAQARKDVAAPAAALLARGYRYPLTTLGTAAGAGFLLGKLGSSPLRLPGVGSLLNGGIAQFAMQGARMIGDLGGLEAITSLFKSDAPQDGDSA